MTCHTSLPQGKGEFTMEYSKYQTVLPHLQEELTKRWEEERAKKSR